MSDLSTHSHHRHISTFATTYLQYSTVRRVLKKRAKDNFLMVSIPHERGTKEKPKEGESYKESLWERGRSFAKGRFCF
jgi:hypothetical protein